jgi:hypothetical protein
VSGRNESSCPFGALGLKVDRARSRLSPRLELPRKLPDDAPLGSLRRAPQGVRQGRFHDIGRPVLIAQGLPRAADDRRRSWVGAVAILG